MPLETIIWSFLTFIIGWAIGFTMNVKMGRIVYIPVYELRDMEKQLKERDKDPNPYRTPES